LIDFCRFSYFSLIVFSPFSQLLNFYGKGRSRIVERPF